VLILVLNERENLARLLPRLDTTLDKLGCTHEVVVVDGGSQDGTVELASSLGARVLVQEARGYGAALREGLAAARGEWILTLDADLSHDPDFIGKLWAARDRGEIVIASRYVKGGAAYMPLGRKVLSRVLNGVFAAGLALPVRDMSSGFRLYRAGIVRDIALEGRNFDVLEELLVKAYSAGWRVVEVPFTYYPRDHGSSHARILRFGMSLLRSFARLWVLRNSIASADYDERAYYSKIPFQRSWQRRRHRIVTTLARGAGRTLDVGCGSSVILQSLNYAVGLDADGGKLRYMRHCGAPLVRGDAIGLPFRDGSFDCVVCCHLLQHLPDEPSLLGELVRVLSDDGLLVIATPDHDSRVWRLIEPVYRLATPGGYQQHLESRYGTARLDALAAQHGLVATERAWVYQSEVIVALRKAKAEPGTSGRDTVSPGADAVRRAVHG